MGLITLAQVPLEIFMGMPPGVLGTFNFSRWCQVEVSARKIDPLFPRGDMQSDLIVQNSSWAFPSVGP